MFKQPFRQHKNIVQLLNMSMQAKKSVQTYKIFRKLIAHNDQTFMNCCDSLKIFDEYLLHQAVDGIQSISKVHLAQIDVENLRRVKEILKIANVYAQRTAQLKNKYIFTTKILDNQFIVDIWSLLTKMEFHANRDIFSKFLREEE